MTGYISFNYDIRDITNVKAIWDFSTTRFVPIFTFALNYHFSGLDLLNLHLWNIIIHLGVTLLVFYLQILLFSKFLKDQKYKVLFALFGALIFLTHPLQTESVTYLSQRMTSVVCFFYILSFIFYIKAKDLSNIEEKTFKNNSFFILSYLFL